MSYQTIKVRFDECICFIQFYRPNNNNTISNLLIEECRQILSLCEESIKIVVLEGLPDVFCFGADFDEIHTQLNSGQHNKQSAEPLYDLWLKMVTGPYITISHVRGKTNAGGMGFIAASDIVIADETARFSLSELLFGLFPACVLPFLIRKIGFHKSHYLTLTTQPIDVQQAQQWGLVDAHDAQSKLLLRKHLLRLRLLPKNGISRYKRYTNEIYKLLLESKELALSANQEVFSDSNNLAGICRYVEKGKFPWEI